MSRLTITLSEARYRALKEASAQRDKTIGQLGLTVAELEIVLTYLVQHAIVLAPVAAPPAPDPGDRLLSELLAARADLLLVTGDKLLLSDAGMRGRVISPQAFLAAN